MSRSESPLRLFVAAYPPHEVRRAMVKALHRMDGLPAYRDTPFDQIHLTLQFVGDVLVKHLDDVIESVNRAASGIGELELTPVRLMSLPSRDVARLVACETDAPGQLLELHRRLATRLARNKTRKDAADRYLPHLTLCRFKRPVRMHAIDARVAIPSFRVEQIQLMRSVLKPTGAEHVCVHECAL